MHPNPHQIPLWAREINVFTRYLFPDEFAYVCQIWSRSVQWFGSVLISMNWWPPNPHARRVSMGYFCLPHLHFQMNMHRPVYVCKSWSRSVQLFGIFPTFLNLWPPWPPPNASWGSRGKFCLAIVHSRMHMHTCVKFGPDRSSGLQQDSQWLLMLVRFLAAIGADSRAQKHAKNNIYTSKIIIPARTCWPQRHYLSSQHFS